MLASPQTLDPKAPSTLSKAIEDLLEQLDQLGKGKLGTSLTGEGIIRLETKASVEDPLSWLHTQKNNKKHFGLHIFYPDIIISLDIAKHIYDIVLQNAKDKV